jgi:hypothetical protein
MPRLSLGLGVQVLRNVGGFDADAAAYFVTAGVTDATAKSQINAFVVGVKGLGLYSNMVCWPLRSTQNAGTGTTVYSLGGLITKNGTLTNGPTWGTDGILFDGINDYINVPFTEKSGYTSHNFGTIATLSDLTTSRIAVQAGGPWIGVLVLTNVPTISDDVDRVTFASYTADTFFGANYNKTGSSFKGYQAGNLLGSVATSVSLSATPLLIGTYATSILFWKGKIAFVHLFNKTLTDGENLSLYTLYKTTLGQGLGLP